MAADQAISSVAAATARNNMALASGVSGAGTEKIAAAYRATASVNIRKAPSAWHRRGVVSARYQA